jgi:Na+/H+-dicarboxylate symporter
MSQATRLLLSLVVGLALGIAAAAWVPERAADFARWTDPVGTLWLNGLRMTIVPLVVSLLIGGIAGAAKAASATRLAGRVLITFIVLLWIFSALGGLTTIAILKLWPMPAQSAEALRAALSGAGSVGEVPAFAEFLKAMVPTNPIEAAATDQLLPLIVFTLVFAFAVVTLPADKRDRLTGLFEAVTDAMLVIINWVLLLAPIGVTALAFGLGARTGSAALGALLHYVVVVSAVGIVIFLLGFVMALLGGQRPGRFTRAVAPVWAIAMSTQSSLASLPAMLRASEKLGVPVALSGVTLPMAVAIFRATSPTMNVAVAFYVASWYGIALTPWVIIAGVAAAAITTLGSVGLPGTISFVTSVAPIAIAIGVPIEPLALLVAVETIPDIFRTLGNVNMDVAVTTAIARRTPDLGASEADAILAEEV